MSKYTNTFPVIGGITIPVIEVSKFVPSIENIVLTAEYAFIGAIIGYLVKLLLDLIFKPKTNAKD